MMSVIIHAFLLVGFFVSISLQARSYRNQDEVLQPDQEPSNSYYSNQGNHRIHRADETTTTVLNDKMPKRRKYRNKVTKKPANYRQPSDETPQLLTFKPEQYGTNGYDKVKDMRSNQKEYVNRKHVTKQFPEMKSNIINVPSEQNGPSNPAILDMLLPQVEPEDYANPQEQDYDQNVQPVQVDPQTASDIIYEKRKKNCTLTEKQSGGCGEYVQVIRPTSNFIKFSFPGIPKRATSQDDPGVVEIDGRVYPDITAAVTSALNMYTEGKNKGDDVRAGRPTGSENNRRKSQVKKRVSRLENPLLEITKGLVHKFIIQDSQPSGSNDEPHEDSAGDIITKVICDDPQFTVDLIDFLFRSLKNANGTHMQRKLERVGRRLSEKVSWTEKTIKDTYSKMSSNRKEDTCWLTGLYDIVRSYILGPVMSGWSGLLHSFN